jgi:hypothetical protein
LRAHQLDKRGVGPAGPGAVEVSVTEDDTLDLIGGAAALAGDDRL